MIILPTFKPPPVEPPQAPINISVIRIICEIIGHELKSAVTKPVVVMTETTWKPACLKAVPKEFTSGAMLSVITPIETAIIPRYVHNSSLFIARLNCFIKMR